MEALTRLRLWSERNQKVSSGGKTPQRGDMVQQHENKQKRMIFVSVYFTEIVRNGLYTGLEMNE
jgi:hypothetical protein